MTYLNRTSALLAAALSLLIAGCGGDTPVAEQTMTGESGVSANGYRKPGAPVRLDYRVPGLVDPGKTIEIEVTVTLDSEVDELVITSSGGDGIELLNAGRQAFAGGQPGEMHTLTLQAIAWESGNRFVNVFAETVRDGNQMRRSFAVPLAVSGDQTSVRRNGEMLQTQDGETVISMPAKEESAGD